MAAIDLIVLGMLKKESLSAYELQKLVEYRTISKWVKISTPSVYKKVLQLEDRGYITGIPVKEGKMPEKAVYTLTAAGSQEFERLMLELSNQPVNFFLDFNAVMVNLDSLPEPQRKACLTNIAAQIKETKAHLEENLRQKDALPGIPKTGMAVLRQQYLLAEAIEQWLEEDPAL